MRHIAAGSGPIKRLGDLRAPMATVFDSLQQQLEELARYKQMYGPLREPSEEDDEGSDTALEY
jgi:adenylate cyclase